MTSILADEIPCCCAQPFVTNFFKRFILPTPVTGDGGRVFQAVGNALPPTMRARDGCANPLISLRRGRGVVLTTILQCVSH